jgi:hypothetical protein
MDFPSQSRGPCPVLASISLIAQDQKRYGEGTRFDLDENVLGPIATSSLQMRHIRTIKDMQGAM